MSWFPDLGNAAMIAAAVFLFIFIAIAFIAFKLLKRTVKMAFRVGIVAFILAVAVAGSIAVWALGSGSTEKPLPARAR